MFDGSPGELSLAAELILRRLQAEPDRVRYDLFAFGGPVQQEQVKLVDQAYEELERAGLTERSGSFINFFGTPKRLYRLSPKGDGGDGVGFMTVVTAGAPDFARGVLQLQDEFVAEHGDRDLVVRVVLNNGESPYFYGGLRIQASVSTGLCLLRAVGFPLPYAVLVRPSDMFRIDFEIHVPQEEPPRPPIGFSAGPRS